MNYQKLPFWNAFLLKYNILTYLISFFIYRNQHWKKKHVHIIKTIGFFLDTLTDLFRGAFRKRCSENMQQLYKKTLWHMCSSVYLLHFFETPFCRNSFGEQLLDSS